MPTESPGAETSLERLSPDDLVSSFSKSHLIRWFLVALGLHALVIGGLSLGTIRDLVDPEGAKARREAAVATAQAAATSAPAPAAAEPAAAETPAAAGTPPPSGSAALSPVERATTEAASPAEIPRVPDDLGLSIEDTNPQ
jgi:hypothetical protein